VLEELAERSCGRGILEKYNTEELVTQALTQLNALYKARYLGMLPEEVSEYTPPSFTSAKKVLSEDYVIGFNSAIQEMREKIG